MKTIVVNDLMQNGYTYLRTEKEGKNFHPGFHPDLTPCEMLSLGIFGGRYMTDCREEFPLEWFQHAPLCHERHDPALNYFGVLASSPLRVWREKGWIWKDDVRGWFQWYCRYYMGRRCEDDLRQIRRHIAMRRHLAQLKKGCAPFDVSCRVRQRQALLQWAYDTRMI